MIKSKADYQNFIKVEAAAYHKSYPDFTYEHRILIKFLKLYRKVEYFHNCRKDLIGKIYYQLLLKKYQRQEIKYQIFLSINTIDIGLRIIHVGPIYIHGDCQIGKNFKIHPMTVIRDDVWVGPGVKIFGKIKIGDGAVIGANALVNKDIEANATYAGNPAQKINDKGYRDYFKQG